MSDSKLRRLVDDEHREYSRLEIQWLANVRLSCHLILELLGLDNEVLALAVVSIPGSDDGMLADVAQSR